MWFRDWLRAHDAERDRYAQVKRQLAAEHAATAITTITRGRRRPYLDEAYAEFESWARRGQSQ